MDDGDLCVDGGDLREADDSKLTIAGSQTPQLPPRFSEASHENQDGVFPSCIPAKGGKTPTFPR